MTLSAYRSAPRVGHLERAKHLIGYLVKNRNRMVRIRKELPDFSGIEQPALNWSRTPYNGAREIIDPSAPEPLGKAVRCTTFVDANLYHCHISGRAVTGILHFLNGTPVDWFSKKQTTVQTATFGSESWPHASQQTKSLPTGPPSSHVRVHHLWSKVYLRMRCVIPRHMGVHNDVCLRLNIWFNSSVII
jgi:hypothetical protein